jgi:hypothetical protein
MPSKVIIAQAAPYTLTSHGNGWAYELTHEGEESVWVQDDDATEFRSGYDALETFHPDWPTAIVLRELFAIWGPQ